MSRTISSSDRVIDSRDVIERIEELESDRETLAAELDEAREALESIERGEPVARDEATRAVEAASAALAEWDASDDAAELATLRALAEQCEGYGDWSHGETLIHRDYWTGYVQELLQDLDVLPRDMPAYLVIDWDATAGNIEADYMSVDFDGAEYLMRS